MKFNKNQKRTLLLGLLIILAAFVLWLGFGGEIFTKTQVLVEKQDELFGTTYKEWKDQFVLGLDSVAVFSFIALVVCGTLIFLFRTKIKSVK